MKLRKDKVIFSPFPGEYIEEAKAQLILECAINKCDVEMEFNDEIYSIKWRDIEKMLQKGGNNGNG